MNEIEKLYENARIEKELDYFECNRGRSSMRCCPVSSDERDKECSSCFFRDKMKEVYEYPLFTAEKQLDIVKQILFSTWWMNLKRLQFAEKFDEGLAQMINEFWQDLTEEEKQQIKEILSE